MHRSSVDVRSLDSPERQWIAWQADGEFTKNPDIVSLPSGKMLCVFNATDFHWPKEFSRITVIESTDQGRTWGRPRIVHETNPGRGDEERWVTPRLSLLRDGRLVIICDQNDHTHMHERQSPGIYAWWSNDGGESWDGPIPTGVPGIEPDRVRELADGTLLIGTQFTRAATQKLAEAVVRSTDGGQTWGELSIIASDAVHNYCEGAIITLRSGRLACIMRENNHNNYPSYLSFSDDQGHTWTKPVEAPFSGDRPFAGQLADGRTLVTYRNQAGKPGLYAWLGDIESEQGYKVARSGAGATHVVLRDAPEGSDDAIDRSDPGVSLESDCLRLQNGTDNVARYMLLPPESFTSEVRFDCDIQVEGPDDVPAATVQIARIGLQLSIAPNSLSAGGYERRNHPSFHRNVDMRSKRQVSIRSSGGLLEILVDGEVLLPTLVLRETLWDRSFFGNGPDHGGTARWFRAEYTVNNPTEPAHSWQWDAGSGQFPNQYEIDRWLEVDYNSNPRPDHGYSSWIEYPDGEIFLIDYTNEESPPGKALIKGYRLRAEDFDG